tara:strand:+ start:45725 stop:45913 length:189 start_codon:yes stop_codon:yes gene_type:complete
LFFSAEFTVAATIQITSTIRNNPNNEYSISSGVIDIIFLMGKKGCPKTPLEFAFRRLRDPYN